MNCAMKNNYISQVKNVAMQRSSFFLNYPQLITIEVMTFVSVKNIFEMSLTWRQRLNYDNMIMKSERINSATSSALVRL